MSPEIARAILIFMDRVQLNGREVDAFNTCRSILAAIAATVDTEGRESKVDHSEMRERE